MDGYAEMVPAIMPSVSADGAQRIEVWLRIPEGGEWTVRSVGGRLVPIYPPGTVADRIDLAGDSEGWRIADVRGGTLLARGMEYHVLRPDPDRPGQLVGFAWRSDDPAGQQIATRDLVHLACRDAGTDIRFFRRRNRCGDCHGSAKPAQRADDGQDVPFEPTDASGLYGVLRVLRDDAEVEHSRGFDENVGRPGVGARCSSGTPVVKRDPGDLRVVCPDAREVPLETYDVRSAMRAGDEHARRLCASRRYLFERASVAARRTFADAFEACGIQPLRPSWAVTYTGQHAAK